MKNHPLKYSTSAALISGTRCSSSMISGRSSHSETDSGLHNPVCRRHIEQDFPGAGVRLGNTLVGIPTLSASAIVMGNGSPAVFRQTTKSPALAGLF
ncbi:hypothetical protein ABDX87_07130 [Pseudomonas abietaniphila]|uniref:hypothetical protein n=1 Tax=Pseudomonas abietaniphila TaxID=89065 RepID=UPI003217ED25